MRRHVLVFMFDWKHNNGLFAEKFGTWDGLDGKMEEGEAPEEAAVRVLREWTRGLLGDVVLAPFGRIRGFDAPGVPRREAPTELDHETWLFCGSVPEYFPGEVLSIASGDVRLRSCYVFDLHLKPVRPDVLYLMPLARNHALGKVGAVFHEIIEAGRPGELRRGGGG